MKNILFISSWYPNRNAPTLGNFVERHAQTAALYNKVWLIAAFEDEKDEVEIEEQENFKIYKSYFVKKLPILSYRKALKKAYKLALKDAGVFHIAHLNVVYPAATFLQRLRIPFVVTEHFSGYHSISGHQWSRYQLFVLRKVLNRAKLIMPVSDHLGKAMMPFTNNQNFKSISNVVDESIFNFEKKENSIPKFFHISTLQEESKNIKKLLEGFKILIDRNIPFELEIGGDGDLDQLKQNIKNTLGHQEYIKVFGSISSKEVANKMKASSCFVMFSRFENQPCVILEALCTGTPVISSDVGGIPQLINTKNGILVERDDLIAFQNALLKFTAEMSSYNHEEISREAILKYSKSVIAKQLHGIYLSHAF